MSCEETKQRALQILIPIFGVKRSSRVVDVDRVSAMVASAPGIDRLYKETGQQFTRTA